MSLAELKEAVAHLSAHERAQLRDVIDALQEGVSVKELHAIDRALDEALESNGPRYTIEQARAELKKRLAAGGKHAVGSSARKHRS